MSIIAKRSAKNLRWFLVLSFLASILMPAAGEAQGVSTKMRTSPYGKMRTPAKMVMRNSPGWIPNPAVSSKDSYLIVDAMSGRELLADRPDELRHPASLTKLMTLYLAFSAIDSGRLSLGDALPVSMNALNASPTKMGMLGGSVNVRDAVMGLVTRSANDAAIVLGEALGGDEESFARLMTQKARQLGMSSTVYRNASGLPDREQVTTARDMAKLAHALLRDFPHYYPVFSVQSYFYKGRTLANHNAMLQTYAGADGLKTGYTIASGFNLVMSALRDDRRMIGVVMGGDTAYRRDRLMADLMDQGFAAAQAMNLATWVPTRPPRTARFSAANFVPGVAPPAQMIARNEQVARTGTAGFGPGAPLRPAGAAPATLSGFAQGDGTPPATGSWVIQVGSFSDSRAAQTALERAAALLPENIRARTAPTLDEVQMAQKTFHRARLTNLSQDEAMNGCKRMEQRKIFCSALQVTAWNGPNGR